MITLSNLKSHYQSKKRKKRVGRGNSSGHGTYSGRGQKGQRARSGGRKGLKLKGFKPIVKRIPKIGGFQSSRTKYVAINLAIIEKLVSQGLTKINPNVLLEKKIIRNPKDKIKILGQGTLTKSVEIWAHNFSRSAEEAIKKVGGRAIKVTNS